MFIFLKCFPYTSAVEYVKLDHDETHLNEEITLILLVRKHKGCTWNAIVAIHASSVGVAVEAVNTTCYVQNRVLVVKPHNKTPYELFHGKEPTLSFMRPFGCPVTILNTIDHLGKFDENEYNDQEKEDNVNNTNNVNTVSSTVNAADTNEDNELLFDPNMPSLEDVNIFNFSNDDEDDGTMADMNNLDTTIQVEEKVYVCQPPGFEDPDFPDRVFKKKDGIFISQDKYVAKILKKFGFTKVKTVSTPMETHKPLLTDEDGEEVDVHMYRYQVNPKVSHLYVVKRIFRYLKGQPKSGLWYQKDSHFDLVAYTDSDYARASLDIMSTTGGCQLPGCRLISWQCKKQTVVANSTIKAEYVAASSCCGQALWIQNQLLDYGLKGSVMPTDPHHIPTILQSSSSQPQKTHKPRKPTTKVTQVPQPNEPIKHVADEAVHKELGDSLVRSATTASSLRAEQDSDNIVKTQSKETPNESSSQRTDSGGGPRVLELKKTKTFQHKEIASLKRRVKKLKKRNRSRTHKLKRLYKVGLTARVESSDDEESLGEDASKQERIKAIDTDEDITLVNDQNDANKDMFDVNVLGEKPMKPKKKDQIKLNEEAALKLQAELNEEERLTNKEEVANDAISLAVKSPRIVDWKIHKEGKKSYYQIVRADRKSQMYMVFSKMLEILNKEDLEDLYKLVKAKLKSTRPMEDLDLLL
nr:hypothetical protein [Tanacetum cinerariifolium]